MMVPLMLRVRHNRERRGTTSEKFRSACPENGELRSSSCMGTLMDNNSAETGAFWTRPGPGTRRRLTQSLGGIGSGCADG